MQPPLADSPQSHSVLSNFVEIYMKDAVPRTRETTYANKRYLFDKKGLPYFGEMPLSAIKPTDIRNWQNELINFRQPNGEVMHQLICEPLTTSLPQPSILR